MCIAREYKHVKIRTHIFCVPAFFLVVFPWTISNGPNTSMPHSRKGGVLASRWGGSGAIGCVMVGARSILHCTHVLMSLSILRLPPSGKNPRCLIDWVVCFLPVWQLFVCRNPMSAFPVGVFGMNVGNLRPKVTSA